MISSLLYVSQSLLTPANEEAEVASIVTVARSRNLGLRITGVLISTVAGFAQILEGSTSAIDELMISIHRDPRHTNIRVLTYGPIERRRFAVWSLGYSGPSSYLAARIKPLLNDPNAVGAASQMERLARLMSEFAGR